MPKFTVPNIGSQMGHPTDENLVMTPEQAVQRYADVLQNGTKSQYAGDFADDYFRQDLQNLSQTVQQGMERNKGSQEQTFTPVDGQMQIMRSSEGGDLVVAQINSVWTRTAGEGRESLPASDSERALFGDGKATSTIDEGDVRERDRHVHSAGQIGRADHHGGRRTPAGRGGAKDPAIAQAFGGQGAPALFALIGGRPMPNLQGVPSNEELTQITSQVLPQLVQVAAQAGVTGTAPYIEPSDGDASAQQTEPQVPAAHAEAHRLAQSGDYAGAAAANADVREVGEAAASNPDDVQAQLAVADVDIIGGQIQDAFSRLLDFAGTHRADLEPVRQRLLEYFLIPDPSDERLAGARRRLATLMY